jgi:hypothetical protein
LPSSGLPIMMRYQPLFAPVSLSEQASSGDFSFPTIAQLAFVTMSLREYDDVSAIDSPNVVLSGSCWAFATQNGTGAATTALSTHSWASFSAVDEVVHPSCGKPTVATAITPATVSQTPGLSQTGVFVGVRSAVGGLFSSHRHISSG